MPFHRHAALIPTRYMKQWDRAGEIARVLAWAAKLQAPLAPALASLVPVSVGYVTRDPESGQWTCTISRRNRGFHSCLLKVCDMLLDGEDLGVAMDIHLSRKLPDRFLALITGAENAGLLDKLLPNLPERVTTLRREGALRQHVWLSVLYLAIVCTFASGWMTFILPKFRKMYVEMTEYTSTTGTGLIAFASSKGFAGGGANTLPVIALAGSLAVLMFWLLNVDWFLRRAGPLVRQEQLRGLIASIPVLGRLARDQRRLRLAETVAVGLDAGMTLRNAAAWAMDALNDLWLNTRVRRFVKRLDDGQPWPEAWRRAGLSDRGSTWFLATAAAAEVPTAGFTQVIQHLRLDLARRETRLIELLGLCRTAILATIVFLVALCTFAMIAQTVIYTAGL